MTEDERRRMADSLARELYKLILPWDHLSWDLKRLSYLIEYGMETPEMCDRCGERAPELGRMLCVSCGTATCQVCGDVMWPHEMAEHQAEMHPQAGDFVAWEMELDR
jgi:hypothetical protein